jgi:hypothetical protein
VVKKSIGIEVDNWVVKYHDAQFINASIKAKSSAISEKGSMPDIKCVGFYLFLGTAT